MFCTTLTPQPQPFIYFYDISPTSRSWVVPVPSCPPSGSIRFSQRHTIPTLNNYTKQLFAALIFCTLWNSTKQLFAALQVNYVFMHSVILSLMPSFGCCGGGMPVVQPISLLWCTQTWDWFLSPLEIHVLLWLIF